MRPEKQHGFALATAIFLVVVLAGLALVIVTVSGTQHLSSARDVMGAKAYQAARAGVEWGAYRVLRQSLTTNPLGNGVCPATTTFALPAADLAGFSVQVECSVTLWNEGSRSSGADGQLELYQITATACNQAACPGTPGGQYVERQIRATISR